MSNNRCQFITLIISQLENEMSAAQGMVNAKGSKWSKSMAAGEKTPKKKVFGVCLIIKYEEQKVIAIWYLLWENLGT